MRRSRGRWLVAFACATAWARAAHADDDPLAGARRTFAEAVEAQEAGRHREALALYARVREVVVSPTLLFNVAVCRESLGELLEARHELQLALEEAERKDDVEVQREAKARIEALEAQIPRLVVRFAPGTADPEAALDRTPIAIDTVSDLRVDPGSHVLSIRSERHARVFELAFEVQRGAVKTVDVDLGPARDEPAPVISGMAPPERAPSYVPAIVAGGVAVALGTGAVVTGVVGLDVRSRYADLNAQPTAANHDERASLRSQGNMLYGANAVLAGAAVVAAGVGIYFALRPPSSSPSRRSAYVVVAPSGIGGGATF